MKNERLTAIDGLCAIFGMGIVVYHVNTVFDSPFPSILSPVFKYGGYFGNYMFFIISGFLVTLRYRHLICGGGITRFILKRFWRLYPTYFLSNLAMIMTDSVTTSLKRTLATFLMVSTGWFYGGDMPYNFPAWFINVLMLCYIIYFVIGKISSEFPAAYLPLCCFFVIWGAALEVFDWNVPFLYCVCGEGYMNFFLGVLLGEKLSVVSAREGKSLKRRQPAECLVSSAMVCISMVLMFRFGLSDLPGNFRWWISLSCVCLVTMALSGRVFAWVLSVPVLQMIGRCCLSLSLWHIPLVRVWQKTVQVSWLDKRICFVLYLLLTLVVSYLSYCCIERHFCPGNH